MAEDKDIAQLADNDIIVEIEVQEAPTVVIDTTSTTTAEISEDSAIGFVVSALPTLAKEKTLADGIASIESKFGNISVDLTPVAKEATLLAKVAELKEILNSIYFTTIEQAIQGLEDVIKAVENIDFTDLENSIAEVKNEVANIDFSSLAKEDTLTQVASKVEKVGNKIDNIKLPEIDTAELAKQGENQEATNSKILEEVQNKLTPLEAVLTELNNGKEEMVDALKLKNVESSTNKTLSAIAKDIRSIAQEPITIDGGEMYEKQIFGTVTDKTLNYSQPNSPIWNLYQVMVNLLNDGRFITYGGILLAEYNKNISSIELNKAGSGGAYLTSDGAYYQEDVTHTWNDLSDPKVNRWVAYLFANEARSFEITSTNNPLSIHVGRHLGTISLSVNAALSSLVVTDGNKLDNFISNTYTTNLKGGTVLRNIGGTSGSLLYKYSGNKLCAIIGYLQSGKILIDSLSSNCDVYIQAERLEGLIMGNDLTNKTVSLIVDCPYIYGNYKNGGIVNHCGGSFVLKNVMLITEYAVFSCWVDYNTEKFSFFYKINDKTQMVSLVSGTGSIKHNKCLDVELQEGWCKPLSVVLTPNLTEENMINHILKRLKQDEEMCGSGVTITLGATNLTKLTSEEAVALLDSLTNIYGYTFA